MPNQREDQQRRKLLSLHLQNLLALEEARAIEPESARWEPQRQELLARLSALADALQLAPTERSLAALSRLTELEDVYARSLAQRERSLNIYIESLELLEAGESLPSRVVVLGIARRQAKELARELAELSAIRSGHPHRSVTPSVTPVAAEQPTHLREDSGVTTAKSNSHGFQPASRSDELRQELRLLVPGVSDAARYQQLMLNILTYVFSTDLVKGRIEASTIDETERRDIVLVNQSEHPFWQYVRHQYGSYLVMFEAKNVTSLDSQHVNQVSTYLGDRIGRLGFIVTRNTVKEAQTRKIMTVFNDSHPRKVILTLDDHDIEELLTRKVHNINPTEYIQQLYEAFKLQLQ